MDAPPVKTVRGYEPAVNRHVAVNIILPEHANRSEFAHRSESEAPLTSGREGLHIVPLYDHLREMKGGSPGLVLYEFLTGRYPFSGVIPGEIPVKRLRAPVPSLATELPERSAPLDEVIQKSTPGVARIASPPSRLCYKPFARPWLKRRRRCLV